MEIVVLNITIAVIVVLVIAVVDTVFHAMLVHSVKNSNFKENRTSSLKGALEAPFYFKNYDIRFDIVPLMRYTCFIS
ncbi:hypothetical protein ACPFMY_000458 [Vibrio cholerae]